MVSQVKTEIKNDELSDKCLTRTTCISKNNRKLNNDINFTAHLRSPVFILWNLGTSIKNTCSCSNLFTFKNMTIVLFSERYCNRVFQSKMISLLQNKSCFVRCSINPITREDLIQSIWKKIFLVFCISGCHCL